MKKAVLLSAGPSLAAYKPRGDGALVFAVNRVAAFHACDYWIAGDEQTIRRHCIDGPEFVIGTPCICTLDPSVGWAERTDKALADRHRWLTWEALRDATNPPDEWCNFSAPIAFMLAVHLGIELLDVHGVDMAGDRDFRGDTHHRFRDNRWERERRNWDLLYRWAIRLGVAVRIHDEAAVAA